MKFRTKTVLGVTLIQAVLLAVLVLSVLAQMRAACRQQIEHRATVTTQLLSAAARDPMVAFDLSTLRDLAADLVASGQVAYVEFLDESGNRMAASGVEPEGNTALRAQADEHLLGRSVAIEVAGTHYGQVRFGIELDEMTALLAAVKNKTIAIALGVMAAVAVFSMFFGTLLTKRLNDLSIASRAIAGGHLNQHVNDEGQDELADTARSFNHMAHRLAVVSEAHAVALQELRTLAYHDPLTGAHNRRSFLDAMAQEHLRVQRTHSAAGLLMLDIDHFKRVNDTWGHDAGDEVLKHLVTVLQGNLRRIDTLGRLGGEEFAVLLPATTLAGAAELAERLRLAVQESPAVIAAQGGRPATEVAFTISVGVAALDPRQPRTEQVLKHADVAMYEAKSTGRNKVCVSPPAAAAPVQTATS